MDVERRLLLAGFGAAIGAAIWQRARADEPQLPQPAYIDITGHVPPLEFSMEDVETGRTVTAASFRGHPVILYFGFTRCPDTCPLTMQNAATLLRTLGRHGKDMRVLFATVDLTYDTAPRLKGFMAKFGPPPQFTGLRATPAELKKVADRYGVFYEAPSGPDAPDPVSKIGHSSATYLFGPNGESVALLTALPTAEPKLDQDAMLIRKTMRRAA